MKWGLLAALLLLATAGIALAATGVSWGVDDEPITIQRGHGEPAVALPAGLRDDIEPSSIRLQSSRNGVELYTAKGTARRAGMDCLLLRVPRISEDVASVGCDPPADLEARGLLLGVSEGKNFVGGILIAQGGADVVVRAGETVIPVSGGTAVLPTRPPGYKITVSSGGGSFTIDVPDTTEADRIADEGVVKAGQP